MELDRSPSHARTVTTPLTPPPSYHRPSIQAGGFRRSFTQPPRSLSFYEQAGLDPSDSAANVLFTHSRARVVSFTPPVDAVRSISTPASYEYDYPVDTVETLPWASSTETVVASGSLVIEKVQGSTNFLKSGPKPLHALMRNSQCWCVDGEAILVMRIGPLKYYRIELPHLDEEDKAKVQELKQVLRRILRFEATPCPFKRGFHVDLPESATTPRKRGPWKRKPGSLLLSPVTTPKPASDVNVKKFRAYVATDDELQTAEQLLSSGTAAEEPRDFLNEAPENGPKLDQDVEEPGGADSSTDDSDNEDTSALTTAEDTNSAPKISRAQSSTVLRSCPARDHSPEPSDGSFREANRVHIRDKSSSPSYSSDSSSASSSEEDEEKATDPESANSVNNSPGQQIHSDTSSIPLEVSSGPGSRCSIHHEDVNNDHIQDPKAERIDYASGYELDQDGDIQQEKNNETSDSTEASASAKDAGKDDILETCLSIETTGLNSDGRMGPGRKYTEHADDDSSNEDIYESLATQDTRALSEVTSTAPESEPESHLSDAVSLSSRAASFHSLASAETSHADGTFPDIAESGLAQVHNAENWSPQSHRRDVSEATITVQDTSSSETNTSKSAFQSPITPSEDLSPPSLFHSSASDSSWPDVESPTAVTTNAGLRRRPQPKRPLSPLPPEANIFSPSRQSTPGIHLAGAILPRARHFALEMPVQVVAMLIHILARIAGGATFDDVFNGDLFRRPGHGHALLENQGPAHNRPRPEPTESETDCDFSDDEDDFGIPVTNHRRANNNVSLVAVKAAADEEMDLASSDLD